MFVSCTFVDRHSDAEPRLPKFRAASMRHVYSEVGFSASLQRETAGGRQRDCVLLSIHPFRCLWQFCCWCCSFAICWTLAKCTSDFTAATKEIIIVKWCASSRYKTWESEMALAFWSPNVSLLSFGKNLNNAQNLAVCVSLKQLNCVWPWDWVLKKYTVSR